MIPLMAVIRGSDRVSLPISDKLSNFIKCQTDSIEPNNPWCIMVSLLPAVALVPIPLCAIGHRHARPPQLVSLTGKRSMSCIAR